MDKTTVEVEIVRNSDGTVDVAASADAASAAFSALIEKENVEGEVFNEALGRVWEQNPEKKSMDLETLTSLTMANIVGVSTSEFSAVSSRLKSYIRNARETYNLARGAKGGVQLLSRLTPEELSKVEESRARTAANKAAKKAA